MRIFTYPKIIFIAPTMVTALVCGFMMLMFHDNTVDPTRLLKVTSGDRQFHMTTRGVLAQRDEAVTDATPLRRFTSPQNILGVIFLLVFSLNILIMAIDFPRFTVFLLVAMFFAVVFFLLWLNVYFDLLPPLVRFLENVYAVANAGFYFMIATVIVLNFGVIYVTRFLDYWEILPNEILHNHGPFSDLERYPTAGLKFDKEIPDILEYALLRSGRLVLHMANERKAIVLDNVLWIDSKEEELKKLMSRLEVRITSDQEADSKEM